MGRTQSIFQNISWLLSERVFRVCVGLVVNISIARHLGPSDFGMLSYALAFSAIFGVIGGLGVDDVLARDLVRNKETASSVFLVGVKLKCVGALCAYAGSLVFAWLWRPDDFGSWLIVAVVVSGLLFSPAEAIDVWFRVQERTRQPSLARKAAITLAAIIKIGLIAADAPVVAFAAAVCVEVSLIAATLTFALFTSDIRPRVREGPSPFWSSAMKLLQEGWPLMLSGVLVAMTMQADRIILLRIAGEQAAGVYSVAARMTEVLYVLPLTVGAVVVPRLTGAQAESATVYWNLARKTLYLLVAASFVICLVFSTCSGWIIPGLFGESYRQAAELFALHVWTLAFVSIVSIRSRLLVIDSGTRIVLTISMMTTATSLLGNLMAIPLMGAKGAAVVSLCSWGASAVLFPFFFSPTRALLCNLVVRRQIA